MQCVVHLLPGLWQGIVQIDVAMCTLQTMNSLAVPVIQHSNVYTMYTCYSFKDTHTCK